MRLKFKIAPMFLMLVACAIVGLWQTEGRRTASAQQGFAPAAPASRPHANVTIRVADGSLIMKDLKLNRAGTSTILKGSVVNKEARSMNQATFEIRAYDRAGKLLRGVEEKTIFTVYGLKARASAPLNSGYGVWLQGIPPELVARIEVHEIRPSSSLASIPLEIIPFTSHAMFSRLYAETEE